MFSIGQIVYSKCGRDSGKAFLIKSFFDEYAFLIDGDLRKLESPKKKKLKHVQITNYIDEDIKEKLVNNLYILNSDIRKALIASNISLSRCKKEVENLV